MFKPLLGLAVSVCAAAAGAQLLKDLKPITAAMEAAQETAARPGDAALSCAALERELVRTMNGPAIQGYAAKAGVAAQKDYEALQSANATMTGSMAATIATSLAPAGFLQLALAQATSRVQARADQTEALIAILPPLMRSQHVMALAFTKQCPWTIGAVPLARVTPAR